MSKRILPILVLMVVVALLLPTVAIAQGDYEGYVRYPITSEPPHLDAFTQTTIATALAINPAYEGLVSYDAVTGEFEPAIAESWEIGEDDEGHMTITFHIREGVLFHDVAGLDYGEEGRQVTAQDVKWNYLRYASGDTEIAERAFLLEPVLGGKAYTDGEADDIPGLVVVDDSTFQIVLETPDRLFMINGMIRIAAPEAYEQLGDAAYNTPVGTGPYTFVEWLPENRLVYEKNSEYWNPELPKNEGILFVNYGDPNTALLDYREDNVDFVFSFPSGQLQSIIEEFPDDYFEQPGLHIRYWGFQFHNEFIAENLLVRQAISHALDRVTAWDIFEEGARFPAHLGLLAPAMPASTPASIYEYDLDAAAALLEEAGFPGGEGIPVLQIYLLDPIKDEAQVVLFQQALEELGIEVEFTVEDSSTYWDSIEQPEVHIYQTGWSSGIPDPAEVFDFLVLEGADNGHYEREDVNDLLRSAQTELDADAREMIYQQVHDIIMADAAFIPSAYSKVKWLQKSWVAGFEPGGGGTFTADLALVEINP